MLHGLTGWDWFIGLTLLLSIGVGIWRGLTRTVFAIGAWVLSFLGAPVLAGLLGAHYSQGSVAWFTLAGVFVLMFALIRFSGFALARGLANAGLGGIDRALGAVLGLVRALVIVAVAAVGAFAFGYHKSAAWQRAASKPMLNLIVDRLQPFLPERISGIRKT